MGEIPTADAYIATDDGHFVSQKMMDVAGVIKDYDSWLELRWIPPDKRRTPGDKLEAYAIFDTHPNTNNRPIMYFKETDTPEEVLIRLFHGDLNRGEHPLKYIDAHNTARKLLEHKRWMNQLEEAQEEAAFLMRSPLNYLKIRDRAGDLVKLDDQRRRVLK